MIRQRRQIRKFVLGKASQGTPHGEIRRKQKKNLEAALIVSLILAILFFRVTTDLDIEKYLVEKDHVLFESIDIPELPPPTEQKQQLKMEQVVEIEPEEPELVEEGGKVKEIIQEIEELLKEDDETQLALTNDEMKYLMSDSPLDLGGNSGLNIRKSLASNEGAIKLRRGDGYLVESSGGLDIGKTAGGGRSITVDNSNPGLELKEQDESNRRPKREESQPTLGITGSNERILSFSSSTIGTEDYKVWNKIISELDRLNKGRYGKVIEKIERNRGGFKIHFNYADRTAQEIHWRRNGNVWIKVIGNSNKSTIQELRRALSGLLRLSL